MLGLEGPWLLLVGYVVALLLLYLGSRFERGIGVTGRGRGSSAVAFALAAAVATATTLYWSDWAAIVDVPVVAWVAVPIVLAVLVFWYLSRRATWAEGLAARVHPGDGAGRPSFGVLPANDEAVDRADPRAGFVGAIELEHRGRRLVGVEYRISSSEGSYHLVEVQTPEVPTLVVRPRPTAELYGQPDGAAPSDVRPLQDARLTRNDVGALRVEQSRGLDVDSRFADFTSGDADFDRRFAVRTTDPEFARAALGPDARALLVDELWFGTHGVTFHHGALWASESGRLAEEGLFEHSRQLTRLAGSLPDEAWHRWGGRPFGAADTGWAAWHGVGGETGADSVRERVNQRRREAKRPPLSAVSIVVRAVLLPVLLVVGASPVVNAALAATGLAPDVRLTITDVQLYGGNRSGSGGSTYVSGTYPDDGETGEVTESQWWSFDRPKEGETVEVSIGPVWWNPMIESVPAVLMLTAGGLAPLLAAYVLAKLTFFPKRKVREPAAPARSPLAG